MPLQTCSVDGKDGYRWGAAGKCYPHDGSEAGKKAARKKAIKQGLAMGDGKLNSEADTTAMAKAKQFALETVDLEAVEIMAADVTVHGGGSPPEGDTYSVDDLAELADASNAVCADLRPPLKIGHNSSQRLLKNSGLSPDEHPRAGSLENFRVMGDKLVCDVKQVPKKLAELIQAGAFRLRSCELRPIKSQRDQKVYKQVVSGLALLGAVAPAFQTLDDIVTAWYSEEGVEGGLTTAELMRADHGLDDDLKDTVAVVDFAVGEVVWNGEDGAMDIMDDLSAALNPGPADPRYWIRDVRLGEEPAALVQEYGSGAVWVVPFDMQDGDPVPAAYAQWVLVEQMWVQTTDGPDGGSRDNAAGGNERVDDTTTDTRSDMADENTRPDLTDEQIKAFAAIFKLGEDADQEKVYAAMEAANQPSPPAPDPDPAPPSPGEGGTGDGVTLTRKQFTELVRDSQKGAEFAEKFRRGERDAYLRQAVTEGRIMPSQVKDFAERYDEDETFTRSFVEALPKNEEWARVYGADFDGSSDDGTADERFYADMCASLGIDYEGPLNRTTEVAA